MEHPTRSTGTRRRTATLTATLAVLVTVGLTGCHADAEAAATRSSTPSPSATSSAAPYRAPSADAVAALPEARYDAVIGGLLPWYEPDVPKAADHAYSIDADAPLYGDDRTTPVARFAAKNFLGDPSVIVPVRFSGDWALVMTPSRQALPSTTSGGAAAQTVAWIRRDLLHRGDALADHVVVSVGAQTVSIIDTDGKTVHEFPAGIGAGDTPTPTGVAGYVQARYLDPAQDQTVHRISLTSLHSAAADEPYGGDDGGLIGVHYESVARGAVSHGCVRLDGDAIDMVDALPLGTVVQVVP
ncbi:L,D-transpeptidase catalytic domain [Curtobacterium sp. 9128]|uniref:L,D-transpeptidase n=1 Tax=Curtobacterium sp. 9128 TaxID=1793722 RepID=UPI0007D72D07|nr:L,D-transpeptidase [Curtobacterium sp. 9128]SBN62255.1 L,D-transpeptidase catalytic domain [Curtobacterium sp. 9128]